MKLSSEEDQALINMIQARDEVDEHVLELGYIILC